jgi:pimeloyl-ACP methyl ester carboxylesterase
MAEDLTPKLLTAAVRSYAEACFQALSDRGFPRDLFSVDEVAADLIDLKQVLKSDRIFLIAEDSLARVATFATSNYPKAFAGVVLINPQPSIALRRAQLDTYIGQLESDDPESSLKVHFLSLLEQLSEEPLSAIQVTSAGTPVMVTVGALDLALVAAFESSNGNAEISILPSVLNGVLAGDLTPLSEQSLVVRRKIGNPGTVALIASTNSEPDSGAFAGTPLDFALNWPASAFEKPRSIRNPDAAFLGLDVPLQLICSSIECDESGWLENLGTVSISTNMVNILDSDSAVGSALIEFLTQRASVDVNTPSR